MPYDTLPTVGSEVELWKRSARLAVGVVESLDDDGAEFISNPEQYVYLRITESYHPEIPAVPRLVLRRPESGGLWERRGKRSRVVGIRLLEVPHE